MTSNLISSLISVGKQYKSNPGHVVTVNAVCGNEVYYSDEFGLYYHKKAHLFAGQYISNAAYRALKPQG